MPDKNKNIINQLEKQQLEEREKLQALLVSKEFLKEFNSQLEEKFKEKLTETMAEEVIQEVLGKVKEEEPYRRFITLNRDTLLDFVRKIIK